MGTTVEGLHPQSVPISHSPSNYGDSQPDVFFRNIRKEPKTFGLAELGILFVFLWRTSPQPLWLAKPVNADKSSSAPNKSKMSSPFLFLELLENLKTTQRSGWVRRRIPGRTESVADHMYRVAVMCRMVPGFDDETRVKAECMALVHDLGEAIIGDITPFDGISEDDKRLREEMAVKFLACTVRTSSPDFADLILKYWSEYEAGETRASLLVRQMDKLECIDQAIIYEQRSGLSLEDFIALKKQVTLPELQPWLHTRLQDYENLKLGKNSDLITVFISGGPGVGKGTQCRMIADKYDFCHISVGDLLREEAKSSASPYQDFIAESMQKSVLIPAQLTTQLLKQNMEKAQARGVRRFLLDGFPRSIVQARDFELKIHSQRFTIYLNCSETEMLKRLHCRAQSYDRIDDNFDTISRRLQTFREYNAPVMEHLRTIGPIYEIDCGRSVEEVHTSMCDSIQSILYKPY